MIKTWEELGDALAEFENRVSTLEYSVPYAREDKPTPVPEGKKLTEREWGELQQIKSRLSFLQEKLNNHLDKTKAEKKDYL